MNASFFVSLLYGSVREPVASWPVPLLPGSPVPNGSVIAAAIAQRARRARICIMGALLPLNSPVRSAEEYALIDTLSVGRRVAGLLRGALYE